MRVVDLLASLPLVQDRPALGRVSGVTYVSAANPSFVAPELEETLPAFAAGATSVILLSAPAAIGKSTLAAELAYRTGATLWNLASFQVGTGTYLGTLADAFGIAALGGVVNRLNAGDFLVIMDALDEANLRAGERNFEAFIEDLVKVCRDPRKRPSLVLLARAETADLVALYFEVNNVPFARYQIDFFRQGAAEEFIDKRLDAEYDRKLKARAHRVYRAPYITARGRLFSRVFALLGVNEKAPWGEPLVQSFLGYAPVLEAIAAYISLYDNYAELNNALESPSLAAPAESASGLWNFLVQIVESILTREQGKIQPQLRDRLEAKAKAIDWRDWSLLYGAEEQCARVLDSVLRLAESRLLPRNLPSALRSEYEESLQTAVREHPFRGPQLSGFANVVFRDYLYARGLTSGTDLEREGIRDRMLHSEYLTTPLLARFLLLFAEDGGTSPRMAALNFPFFYESIRSQTRINGAIYLSLDQDRGTRVISGTVATGRKGESDTEFELVPDGSQIRFLRVLANAIVSVSEDVVLGWDTESFLLGPEVDLECGVLRTAVSAIRVQTGKGGRGDETGDVLITADRIEHSGVPPQLTVVGPGTLRVAAAAVHPWFQYVRTEPAAVSPNPRILELARFFHRILVKFRGTASYEGLCRGRHTIDVGAVGGSRDARELLRFLLDRGLIEIDGVLYCLRLDRMSEMGIHWADVRGRVLTPGVVALLTEFAKEQR